MGKIVNIDEEYDCSLKQEHFLICTSQYIFNNLNGGKLDVLFQTMGHILYNTIPKIDQSSEMYQIYYEQASNIYIYIHLVTDEKPPDKKPPDVYIWRSSTTSMQ